MEPVKFIKENYTLIAENPAGNPRIIKGMDRHGLYELFAKLGYKIGCEVGVEEGKVKRKKLQNKNILIIEKFSEDAVKNIADNSLDFVYIDADRSYDIVMLDIITWGRKVRKSGIISGNDLTQAVNDYTRVHGIEFYITGKKPYVKKGDTPPSWFWVKLDDIWPNVIGPQ